MKSYELARRLDRIAAAVRDFPEEVEIHPNTLSGDHLAILIRDVEPEYPVLRLELAYGAAAGSQESYDEYKRLAEEQGYPVGRGLSDFTPSDKG